MTVLELLTFTPSEVYKSAPDAQFKDVSSILGKVEGSESSQIFHGLRVEDNNAHAILAWSSVGAHKAFIATPSYSETGAKFQPVFEESKVKDLVMEHAIFEEPFSVLKALLTSPITEIAQLRGDSKEMVEDAKAKVLALADSIEVPGFHGLKVGKVVEVENALLLVGGWDSVEAHGEAGKKSLFQERAGALMATGVKIDLAHVKLYAST